MTLEQLAVLIGKAINLPVHLVASVDSIDSPSSGNHVFVWPDDDQETRRCHVSVIAPGCDASLAASRQFIVRVLRENGVQVDSADELPIVATLPEGE